MILFSRNARSKFGQERSIVSLSLSFHSLIGHQIAQLSEIFLFPKTFCLFLPAVSLPSTECGEGNVFVGVCLSTGGYIQDTPPCCSMDAPPLARRQTVNRRSIRILLECILVSLKFHLRSVSFTCVFTDGERSCGKVIFSHVSVILSTGSVYQHALGQEVW